MNKEKISEIMNNVDVRYIDEAMRVDNSITSVSDIRKKNGGLKWSFGTVAAALVCVLLLGSITVYAFNHEAIKEFLFGKAEDKAFEEVYIPMEKEYPFGTHKLVLNGTIYDEATNIAYMSFEFQDSDGNVVLPDNTHHHRLGEHNVKGFCTNVVSYCVGNDEIYFIFTYSEAIYSTYDDTNYFLRVDKGSDYLEENKLQFVIMDEDSWADANSKISEIDTSALNQIDMEYFLETDKIRHLATGEDFMPQVLNVLEKYGLTSFETKCLIEKEFKTDKCKVTVGRTNILVVYNDKEVNNVILRREDGTEIELIRNGICNLNLGGMFGSCGGQGDEKIARLEFGGIFNENEILTLIVDGVEYR